MRAKKRRIEIPMEKAWGDYTSTENSHYDVSFCANEFRQHFLLKGNKYCRLIVTTNPNASKEAYELFPTGENIWCYSYRGENLSPWTSTFDFILNNVFGRDNNNQRVYVYLELGQ